jgi:hypothetical protein
VEARDAGRRRPTRGSATRRRGAALVAVAVAVVVVVAGAGVASPSAHASSTRIGKHAVHRSKSSGHALGVYVGNNNLSAVRAFEAKTRTKSKYVDDFLDGTSGWSAMVSPHLEHWKRSRLHVVLGVPIIPDGTGATLAGGAAGAYNAYFVTLARNLVKSRLSQTILRLGWEFNGNWFHWSVSNPTDAANFAAYWRNIVKAMRSVRGQAFRFVWNPNGAPGTSAFTAAQAYPGDAYVDYVGTDLYDESWSTPKTPQNAWANDVSAQWGLNWLAGFAAAHGKRIAFPEWSVDYRADGAGLGDDPYFVNQFASWFATHDVAFADLFCFNTSVEENAITDGHFPNSLAAFERDF